LGPSAGGRDGSLVRLAAGEDRVEDGVLGLLDRGVGVVDRKLGVGCVLWLVGFYAIFAGVMYVAMGFGLRDVSDAAKSVEAQTTASGS
jgi:hypothetical protein